VSEVDCPDEALGCVREQKRGWATAADPLSAGTNVICNTTIEGDLVIGRSGRGTRWNIGQCGPNTIHGNLVFTGNDASGDSIAGNTIDRNLVCAGNRSVGAAGNTVKGRVPGGCPG
jgi:hypothetical protein